MLCIPKIGDHLKILTNSEVKYFVVKNLSEYFKSTKEKLYSKLCEEENIIKITESVYIFLATPNEIGKYAKMMQSSPPDNCVYHNNVEISYLFDPELQPINSARLILKSFQELPCQFASVSRTQEELLMLIISVIYLPSTKPRNLLWRYSILNAHCNHVIFSFEKFFKAETACRVTAFVGEIFNLLIIGFYLLHICNSYRPNRLTDLLKFLY